MGGVKITNFDNLSLESIDSDAELIPLLTPEDEKEMKDEASLACINTVYFPLRSDPSRAGPHEMPLHTENGALACPLAK